MNNRFFVLAVSLVLVASLLGFGCLLLWAGGTNFYLGLASMSWPSAEGQVKVSRIDRTISTSPGPVLVYSYQVGDRRYRSSRIQFKSLEAQSSSEAAVQALLDQYPVGSRVEVYFDPAKPSRAVLRRGPHFGPFLGVLAIALVFILPGIATVYLGIRGFRKRSRQARA